MTSKNTSKNTFVIAVGNQKGGVSKTTTTVHLAAALGEKGRRCLIWDLDMNHGATLHLGIPPDTYLGTYEILMGEENPESVIITDREQDVTFPKNVHLIPAKRKLESIDLKLLSKDKFIILQDSLIEPLERLRGMYDYIFLDTAPNATTPTIAAYKAADWFLLTATPDPFAIAGLKEALDDIKSAQRRGNPKLRLLGVVLSNMDTRTRLALTLSEYVDKAFATHGAPSLKFQTNISRSTVIPKAQEKGKTLFQTEPGHKVADQYRALSQELESRLSQFEERQESSPSEPSTSTEASATQQGEFPQAKEALANE